MDRGSIGTGGAGRGVASVRESKHAKIPLDDSLWHWRGAEQNAREILHTPLTFSQRTIFQSQRRANFLPNLGVKANLTAAKHQPKAV